MLAARLEQALPALTETGLAIVKVLSLERARVLVSIGVSDLDVVGLRRDELVTVEVKRRLHSGNIERALLQLEFRASFSDRVYLAVPWRDVAAALAAVPERYGVIGFGRDGAGVVREAARLRPILALKLTVAQLLSG